MGLFIYSLNIHDQNLCILYQVLLISLFVYLTNLLSSIIGAFNYKNCCDDCYKKMKTKWVNYTFLYSKIAHLKAYIWLPRSIHRQVFQIFGQGQGERSFSSSSELLTHRSDFHVLPGKQLFVQKTVLTPLQFYCNFEAIKAKIFNHMPGLFFFWKVPVLLFWCVIVWRKLNNEMKYIKVI